MDTKSLTDVIIEEIADKNISSYALGKLAGVAPVIIQRFLARERGVTLATADKIAKALKLKLCRAELPEPDTEQSDSPTSRDGDESREPAPPPLVYRARTILRTAR